MRGQVSVTPSEAAIAVETARKSSGAIPLRVVGGTDLPAPAHGSVGAGARLSQLRQKLGLSDVQVAESLLLKLDQVQAIEAMDFGRMPGLGYALGYVRAYCELVMAPDTEALVAAFRTAWKPTQDSKEKARTVLSHRLALPALGVVAAGAVGWVLVWAGLHAIAAKPHEDITAPDAAIQAWATETPALPARGAASIEPRTLLKAIRPVRVELRGADGALVLDRMMRPGEEVSTDGLGQWFVTTPDGGALEAHGHGQVVSVGEDGQKVEFWRVPDLAVMAEAARAEAVASAAKDAPGQSGLAAPPVPATVRAPAPPAADAAVTPQQPSPQASPALATRADWAVPSAGSGVIVTR
jgi:cytoskeleton protein RodZ